MVNADGIEILFHPAQTTSKPVCQTYTFGLAFFTPVIGGEAPVLSVLGEGIWWSARRTVEIKKFWISCRLHPLAIHANGHIALQYNTLRTSIIGRRLQLPMEVILDVIDDITIPNFFLLIPDYPQGVWLQPVLVLSKPLFIFFRIKCLLASFLIDLLNIRRLHTIYRLIVTIAQGVQFTTLTVIGCHLGLALQGAQFFQIQIMRMKGKGRDDIIRIGVVPLMGNRRIVDRQQLDDLHTRLYSPINHPSQVSEVAYAIGVFTPQ